MGVLTDALLYYGLNVGDSENGDPILYWELEQLFEARGLKVRTGEYQSRECRVLFVAAKMHRARRGDPKSLSMPNDIEVSAEEDATLVTALRLIGVAEDRIAKRGWFLASWWG